MNCNHPHRSPWTASTATPSSRKHIFHPQCRNIHHHILAGMYHRTLSCRTFPPLVQRFVLGSPQHESKCKHPGSMSTPCSYLDNCLGKPWGHTLWVSSGLSSRTNKRRPDRRNSLHHILVDKFRHRLLDRNRLPLAGRTAFLALGPGVSRSSVQPYNLRWFRTSKTSPIWY